MIFLKPFTLFIITVLCSISCIGQNKIYHIDKIRIHLFYNLNNDSNKNKVAGTISDNILDNKDFILWNTIIGEGSAEGSSDQIFVVAEISGKNSTNEKRILKITCSSEKKILLRQEQEFSIFSVDNHYCYAFLVNNACCGKLKVKLEIINPTSKIIEDQMEKSIDFECGE